MSMTAMQPNLGDMPLTGAQGWLDQDRTTIQWLVIAHDDPTMVRQMSGVIDRAASAVLPIAQCEWDFGDEHLGQAVRWSLDVAGIEHLLLLGHSQTGPEQAADASDSWLRREADAPVEQTGFHRLFDGARRTQEQLQTSKRQFAQQVAQLLEIESVQRAILAEKLQVHTLFYVAHSGSFLRFRTEDQAFLPLSS